MTFQRIPVWLAICSLALVCIHVTHSFSTYYPAMRGFQFYRGTWTRVPVNSRTGSIRRPSRIVRNTDNSARDDTESSGLKNTNVKRLMGLIRCTGWGPSCSNSGNKVAIIYSFLINYLQFKSLLILQFKVMTLSS